MTPDREMVLTVMWSSLLVGVCAGLMLARAALWLGDRIERRRRRRAALAKPSWMGVDLAAPGADKTAVHIWHGGIRAGKATNAAIAERDAYRAEVALMAREDAHPHARSIAAKLTARVQMRMAGGNGHG